MDIALPNETERLLTLQRLDLLEGEAEQEISDLVEHAAKVLGGSMAMVSLIDAKNQCFFARYGTDLKQTPREQSFCQHCVAQRAPLLIDDATTDSRFEDNPLVTGDPQIRSYVGIPIRAPSGIELGALCVISQKPNAFGDEQVELLRPLAGAVEGFIALRERNKALMKAHDRIAKNTRNRLREHDAIFRQSEKTIGASAWQVDLETNRLTWSDGVYEIHGHPLDEEITIEQAIDYYVQDDREMVELAVQRAIENGTPFEFEASIENRDGLIRRVKGMGERVSFDGRADQLLGVFYDITESHTAIEALQFAANHDSLTGLLNRFAFDNELSRRSLDFNSLADGSHLILVDLDRFKDVNDFFGHLVGDAALEEVATRLAECAGSDHLLARWGGDEFVVLTKTGSSAAEAIDLADTLIEAVSEPIQVGSHRLSIGATCGISSFEKRSSAREVLRQADLALYHGKERQPGRAYLHREEHELEAQLRKAAVGSLRKALDEGRVFAGYQPIRNLHSGAAVGLESLLRLHGEKGEIMTASNVLPALLDPTLSRAIFDRMLDSICNDYGRLSATLPELKFVSINATEADLLCHDFVDHFLGRLAQAQIDPAAICLEFTETLLMVNDTAHVRKVLGKLKSAGMSVALDDFGTGFSSLSHLRDFPIDKMKIDRSFIKEITESPNSLMIVQALITMGQNLSLEIIAEGIETEREQRMLRRLNCELGQGYLFGHAESVDRIELAAQKIGQNSRKVA
ncbi:EAL domain-containing protein [Erythrobacter sp.]|uniref:sensor domain-containing phosphodiesterase n=1 Tax=Erythrobacter sp. TaxID=1042 RepID=UPI001B292C3B|nr:EAL domain-containing protein [Erythrobacter sp.]MBO6527723.1 EAL domain-containing protein [Erythrobacter sp.]MBO6530022.1 EAL domain-containing protein [Erythrobacter sp.]